jgi:transposase
LIHHSNLARADGHDATVKDELVWRFRQGVLVGLSATSGHGDRPAERKARLLLECLRSRQGDVLRFVDDLKVPPTSNQAERDLRPSKIQQNISGRLTSEDRTRDRYKILGYLSTAAKNGLNQMTVLREASYVRPYSAIHGCPHSRHPPEQSWSPSPVATPPGHRARLYITHPPHRLNVYGTRAS